MNSSESLNAEMEALVHTQAWDLLERPGPVTPWGLTFHHKGAKYTIAKRYYGNGAEHVSVGVKKRVREFVSEWWLRSEFISEFGIDPYEIFMSRVRSYHRYQKLLAKQVARVNDGTLAMAVDLPYLAGRG